MTKIFTTIVLFGLMAVLSSSAFAQAPPMDMSWAFRSQAQAQAIGDYNAYNAAMTYYNYMQQLRQAGYTGPSLPTGVTPQSLQNSINGAQQATQNYINGWYKNSNITNNAINNYDMRAIRGCTPYVTTYGTQAWACPGY